MSIFNKDIATNSDDVILEKYDLIYDPTWYICLHEKDERPGRPKKDFILSQDVWVEYIKRGTKDNILRNNINEYIKKEDFLHYIKESPEFNKLKFREDLWYEYDDLYYIFTKYNEYVLLNYLKNLWINN